MSRPNESIKKTILEINGDSCIPMIMAAISEKQVFNDVKKGIEGTRTFEKTLYTVDPQLPEEMFEMMIENLRDTYKTLRERQVKSGLN